MITYFSHAAVKVSYLDPNRRFTRPQWPPIDDPPLDAQTSIHPISPIYYRLRECQDEPWSARPHNIPETSSDPPDSTPRKEAHQYPEHNHERLGSPPPENPSPWSHESAGLPALMPRGRTSPSAASSGCSRSSNPPIPVYPTRSGSPRSPGPPSSRTRCHCRNPCCRAMYSNQRDVFAPHAA